MAKLIKVKPEFANREPGFLGKLMPLGERSQEDLRKWLAAAQANKVQYIIDMFDIVDEDEATKVDAKAKTDTQPGKADVKEKGKSKKADISTQTSQTKEQEVLNEVAANANPGPLTDTNKANATP